MAPFQRAQGDIGIVLTRKQTLPEQTHWELAGLSIYNGHLRARQRLHPLVSLFYPSHSRTITAAVQRLSGSLLLHQRPVQC